MRKFYPKVVLVLFALFAGFQLQAQLYTYTDAPDGTPASVAAFASGSNLNRFKADTTISCETGFVSDRFTKSDTFQYWRSSIWFTIVPDPGYEMTVEDVSVDLRRNNKGPYLMRFQYSTDHAVTWVNNGSNYTFEASDCNEMSSFSWDFDDLVLTDTLYIRVTLFGSNGTNGIIQLKDLVLGGHINDLDVDGDGFEYYVDCDDTNPDIYPGAAEVCNGIDDNCDGNIDEDLPLFIYYADTDDDGFGDAGSTTESCSLPDGYTEDSTDCDDSNAAINPGADEICNGIDDNCNGDVDEGLTYTTYYADSDGDGFGDADVSTETCDGAPDGYIADNTDCDDTNADVHPGAEEICNGIDDNCNGEVDETGATVFYADADGDGYGDPESTVIGCEAPDGYVLDNSDCDDTNADVHPGALEICNEIDDNCDGDIDEGLEFTTFYKDNDGDGYGNPDLELNTCTGAPDGFVVDATDCNDFNPAINPGATDICNGIDDNCNFDIDEDAVYETYYADTDGDGYGNAELFTETCDGAPEGYVADNTDCDDTNAAINPGADEICNGIDDNCNGDVDEGLTFTTYYADTDGDGYGDAGVSTETCDGAPEGYVADDTDCDDSNAAINPGADEICNGMDDNCNGDTDEGLTYTTYYADADGDSYGDAAVTAETCDGAPEGYVTDNTDCDDTNAAINPGAEEICNGVDDNCNGDVDEGVMTTWYVDADGDGYGNPDLSVEACDMPEGYVANDGDCNDENAAVNPGAEEICNGADDNCNGEVDEGITFMTWYADTDGDDYGDAGSTTETCDGAPEGYVADNTDCDDTNADVNPAAEEICNGIDDNCDGVTDDVETSPIAITPSGIIDLCKPETVTLSGTAGFESYQWYKNGVALDGETGMDYTTNKPGYYQVEGYNGLCASGLSDVQAVAVHDPPNGNITYPDGLDICLVDPLLLKADYDSTHTYQWYMDGSPIGGETDRNYYATTTGDYYCVINSPYCETISETVTVFNGCKYAGETITKIDLYPNPSNGIFTLQVQTNALSDADVMIRISDMTGRVVLVDRAVLSGGKINKQISTGDELVGGVYFITLDAGSETWNERIVILK